MQQDKDRSPRATFDLVAHLYRQKDFSKKTFGPGPRTNGVLDHIDKEVAEVRENPGDVTEWIDIVLLAFDGAWRAGFTPEEIAKALEAKQTKNESRQWPDWRQASPDQAIEHVASTDHPLIGKVVRYGAGSTALFRVTKAHPVGKIIRLYGDHVMGGYEGRYEADVVLASKEDLATWAEIKGNQPQ